MHAVLCYATTIYHGQLYLTFLDDARTSIRVTVSTVSDTRDGATYGDANTVQLWGRLADYAPTTAAVRLEPHGRSDVALFVPAALCWCSVLDR